MGEKGSWIKSPYFDQVGLPKYYKSRELTFPDVNPQTCLFNQWPPRYRAVNITIWPDLFHHYLCCGWNGIKSQTRIYNLDQFRTRLETPTNESEIASDLVYLLFSNSPKIQVGDDFKLTR